MNTIRYILALVPLVLIAPTTTFAQPAGSGGTVNTTTLNTLFSSLITFINTIAVPVVFALAFILFLFGVFKYFFASGAKADEGRTEGKKFIMWGIIALAVMVSVWGLVNILVRTFGFENQSRPCLPTFSGPCNPAGSTSGTPSSNTTFPTANLNPTQPGATTQPAQSTVVNCVLPNGQQVQLTVEQCRSQSGVIYDTPGI